MIKASVRLFVFLSICLLLSGTAVSTGQEKASFDVLFLNGKIIDGTGNPWFYGDVGIKNGRISAVGNLKKASAKTVIDIKGKIIAPGFIDIHCHAYDRIADESVWTGKNEQRFFAPNFVSQGVTTLVSNQCGYSPLSIRKQRDVLNAKGLGPNTILLIGHNAVRREVMKNDYKRPATAEEVEQMKGLVRKAMEDGAAGLSSGLEYVPSIWSTNDEIVELVKEIVPYGGVFFAHERASGLSPMWYVPSQDPPGPPTMLDNVTDLIEVAERTGGRVVVTHIKARGKNFWGGSGAIIQLIQSARDRGLDIWADCYPYNTSGSDGDTVLIPDWALRGNFTEELKAILADSKKSKALSGDIRHALNWRGGPENIVVMDYLDKTYVGKNLAQLARELNLSDIDLILKLQTEGYKRRGGANLRGFSMSEVDIEAFYRQPWCATSSDANIALPGDPSVHARFYGTFPRKIRHYAMERHVLSVEEAVRTSTSLPALILGLRDRGLLREGFAADLVVFDPETIRDKATFFEPHQFSEGIEYVLVNGTFVVEKGQMTWKRPGSVITRK